MPLRYWEVYTMPLEREERPTLVERFFADLAELGINEIKEGASIKESRERMKLGVQWRFPASL
jgi:predicted transcriptional regulator